MTRGLFAPSFAIKVTALLGLVALLWLMVVPREAAAASVTNWKLIAGAQSSDAGIQANAFLPHDLSVRVGDSITWTVPTGEFHTVTFLSGGAEPPLISPPSTPGGLPGLNPVAAAPSPLPPTPYAGTGFFNSGLMVQGGPSYTLTFTKSGDFNYICLVHSEMKGVIHVESASTPSLPSQALVDAAGKSQAAQLLGQGAVLQSQGLLAGLLTGHNAVTAGIGKLIPNLATLAILRFEPPQRVVHVGDTVTWTNLDPETPHTVTFGAEPPGTSENPFAAFPPSKNVVAGHANIGPGDSVNSGFLGAGGPTQFAATFTAPGTYNYICALHDDLGMVGTIQVVR